jgi:hypothetical protein
VAADAKNILDYGRRPHKINLRHIVRRFTLLSVIAALLWLALACLRLETESGLFLKDFAAGKVQSNAFLPRNIGRRQYCKSLGPFLKKPLRSDVTLHYELAYIQRLPNRTWYLKAE